ncbi:hypothetical protein LX64_02280 [Chitinophaga skermanii]|uniref:ERF1-like protein n=1 Tax=Chitinophaga skermanii TaxID=331697 RepID=A0A327QKF5_9BACT|nr:hypothetical protein [Chitinophaga skermanii]RAJ05126.1 hypothetical protein LX64_02280 [Chitinophaga skermanii]
MKTLIDTLVAQKGTPAVTILFPTHRTHPENKQDAIQLKNIVKTATERLYAQYDKREVWPVIENIEVAEKDINHEYNLDTLIIYASPHFSSVVKLSVEGIAPRVIVSDTFDVRPILKAIQQTEHYYIITISSQKIRLIEAFNDKIVHEVKDKEFPFDNTQYYTTDHARTIQSGVTDNLLKEFFNVADKKFKSYYHNNPLPVVIMGDVRNLPHYKEEMDIKGLIIGEVEGGYDNTDAKELPALAYPHILEYMQTKQAEYLLAIENGQRAQKVFDDLNDIYRAANSGSGDTLYIERDFIQLGKIENGIITLSGHEEDEDVTLKIIEAVLKHDGQVVFMDSGSLATYNGIALVTRF